MSGSKGGKDDDDWVVVSEMYQLRFPGSDEAAYIRYSTFESVVNGCKSREEAVAEAILYRKESNYFQDWEQTVTGSKVDTPPFNSFDNDNADSDDEQILKIMLRSEFDAETKRREQVVKDANAKAMKEAEAERKRKRKKLEKSGKVFYSFPPPPRGVDSPADVELYIDATGIYQVPRLEKPEKDQKPIDLSTIADCKSVMMRTERDIKADRNEQKKAIAANTENIFGACKHLEELHWHNSFFISDIIGAKSGPNAKERMKSIRILSLPVTSALGPEELEEFAAFTAMKELDLRHSLDPSQYGGYPDMFYEDPDEPIEEPRKPYSEPMLKVGRTCRHLKLINLEGILDYDAFDSCLDYDVPSELEYHQGVKVKVGKKEYD